MAGVGVERLGSGGVGACTARTLTNSNTPERLFKLAGGSGSKLVIDVVPNHRDLHDLAAPGAKS